MNWEVILFVSLVIFFTSLGGFYVAKKDPKSLFEWLPYILSVATGILLALAITEFVPHSFEGDSQFIPIWILLGLLSVVFADKYLAPHLGPKHENSCSHHSHGPQIISREAACSSVGCIVVCAFFDGIEIQTAFNLGRDVGWFLALGLFFHVVPEGAIAAGLSLAGGFSGQAARRSVLYISLAMIAGVVFGGLTLKYFKINQILLPFAAGILIYVSIGHLLPVVLKKKWGLVGVLVGISFILGMAAFTDHSHVH